MNIYIICTLVLLDKCVFNTQGYIYISISSARSFCINSMHCAFLVCFARCLLQFLYRKRSMARCRFGIFTSAFLTLVDEMMLCVTKTMIADFTPCSRTRKNPTKERHHLPQTTMCFDDALLQMEHSGNEHVLYGRVETKIIHCCVHSVQKPGFLSAESQCKTTTTTESRTPKPDLPHPLSNHTLSHSTEAKLISDYPTFSTICFSDYVPHRKSTKNSV